MIQTEKEVRKVTKATMRQKLKNKKDKLVGRGTDLFQGYL